MNLIPFLTGEDSSRPHEQLFWRTGPRTALRSGDWKILKNPRGKQGREWELYNLADDIGETNNLATAEPEKLEELTAAWEKINGEMIDPVWTPRK